MGYTTNFTGLLKFKKELKASQISLLKHILEDENEIVDLEINKYFTGIKWNGMEKTYEMDKMVNTVIRKMTKKYKDFKLVGELIAQGEEYEDKWKLVMINNVANIVKIQIISKTIQCPHCDEETKIVTCPKCEGSIVLAEKFFKK
jgi:hypothetical protein